MRLCLVADDYGVNAARTNGIIEAASIISRASLVVNGEDTVRAVTLARKAGLKLGLHFNITEGIPVSGPSSSSSSIVGPDGRFLGKAPFFMKCWKGLVSKDDVMTELRAQLCLFAKLMEDDIPPTMVLRKDNRREITTNILSIDGHHHIQCLPIVFEAITEVFLLSEIESGEEGLGATQEDSSTKKSASKSSLMSSVEADKIHLAGMTMLRIPADPTLTTCNNVSPAFEQEEDCFGDQFWRSVSTLSLKQLERFRVHNKGLRVLGTMKDDGDGDDRYAQRLLLVSPSYFVGFDVMGSALNGEKLSEKLSALAALLGGCGGDDEDDVVELMTHIGDAFVTKLTINADGSSPLAHHIPSTPDPYFHCPFSCSTEREHEKNFYLSSEFNAMVKLKEKM